MVGVTSSDHVGVSVGWEVIEIAFVGEDGEDSVSEFLVICIIRFVVECESEHEVPIADVISGPLPPAADAVLMREGLISSSN